MASKNKDNSVAIIGAGLYGLVTAKTFLCDSSNFFSSITVFEKDSGIGGVWSENRIYPGLASNSPALTYEIPGFPYPEHLRKIGGHVKAADINAYLRAFAKSYDLTRHISFNSHVTDITWIETDQKWRVKGKNFNGEFERAFRFLVVCNGMYHEKNIPAIARQARGESLPKVFHSADVGDPKIQKILSDSSHTLVVGAGKSAIDLATMIASGAWSPNTVSPQVTLIYKRPHWLSPRRMLRGTICFEQLLFSRFVNAWLPFAPHPDAVHKWIAESVLGKWMTDMIFRFLSDDFPKCCHQQDLLETIPDHPMRESLSGALHVVPDGYIESIRDNKIRVVLGSVQSISDAGVQICTLKGEVESLKVDSILFATGYKIPYRNIAFNGFAYSLLNPTVSFVCAHWIAEYFQGLIILPDAESIERGKI
ncbi:FAD/NAD(P)-binding domain-containing protein [Lindgomyces ingoldianus]|uniref:FAD/NAD(P)-binding domain-containing protein n=1 Tax=Lindgomyces ingoldianus TaxID=673940 RepID=A0ACB6Q839_9PLEO|nr:FAD/NAD(P)-binding domain-containing protein [Lindgomyces ingoldianus]KAF2462743.1 FAD/NAD(P)-binding domain-containing protein [Lindgomyces ingoldianus]